MRYVRVYDHLRRQIYSVSRYTNVRQSDNICNLPALHGPAGAGNRSRFIGRAHGAKRSNLAVGRRFISYLPFYEIVAKPVFFLLVIYSI